MVAHHTCFSINTGEGGRGFLRSKLNKYEHVRGRGSLYSEDQFIVGDDGIGTPPAVSCEQADRQIQLK